ncbi:hypothetical protein F5Y08DRAFT_348536 [Xylaria arbuscula]|nr:hypothetical protein F5Y08DRAFT_348536 [Xylaria arbuscula]
MPKLEDICHSRDATITAIREYYTFLSKMYVPESNILVPPEAGWPSIVSADEKSVVGPLQKTPEPLFVLDTELGVVHWETPFGEIRHDPQQNWWTQQTRGSHGRYEENDWRKGEPAWAIPDFFELLKEQFRQLNFIPISPYKVTSVFIKRSPEYEGLIPMLQGIYPEHGWPDLERYDKQACLDAVQRALEERYLDEADPIRRS